MACCRRPPPPACSATWSGRDSSTRASTPPRSPSWPRMVLLAAGGIGIAALLTDWMAVRLGSAALAGLPLLLLFTEPFTLSVGRGFLGTTVAFCVGIAGYLGLLSSEGKDRIREWESQDPSARDAPDTRPLAAAGRRVGFASVLLRPVPAAGDPRAARHPAVRRAAGNRRARRPGRERRRIGRRLPRGEHAALAAAVVGAHHAGPDRARLYHRRPKPRLSPDLRARPAHRFRLDAVQPAGIAGARRLEDATGARARGRIVGRHGDHEGQHRPRRRTGRPGRAAGALPHGRDQGQRRPGGRPVDAHAVRTGNGPWRPVLRGHEPGQLPVGAGARRRCRRRPR